MIPTFVLQVESRMLPAGLQGGFQRVSQGFLSFFKAILRDSCPFLMLFKGIPILS